MNNKSKGFLIGLAVVVVIGMIIAITSGNSEKTFTYDELSITVNGSFTKEASTLKYMNGLNLPKMALVNGNEYVYVDNESKDGYDTIDEYAEAVRDANTGSFDTVSSVLNSNGIRYIELTSKYLDENKKETSNSSKAMLAFYENGDKYWTVQIGCPESSYSSKKSRYLKWAESVTFSGR